MGEEVAPCPAPLVQEALELLESMPGIGERGAPTSIAALGVARDRVPSAQPRASGAGGCPGNTEAAGQRQSGQTITGSQDRRPAVVAAAGAAPRAQGTSLGAQSPRLVNRRKKKAQVAGAPTRLGIA